MAGHTIWSRSTVWVRVSVLENLGTGSPGSCYTPSQCSAICPLFTVPWRESTVLVRTAKSCECCELSTPAVSFELIARSPFIQATVAGLKRSFAKPKVRKEPVTVKTLHVAVSCDVWLTCNVRLAASCFFSFAAFLRFDELAKLHCCEIKIGEASMFSACIVQQI